MVKQQFKCIASIPTTESNYKVAIDRLQSRFGKPELLRHKLLTKITEMKHLENYKTLRDGVDELTATVRALEVHVQVVSDAEYGTLLMPIVEARRPKSWKLLWARKKTEVSLYRGTQWPTSPETTTSPESLCTSP